MLVNSVESTGGELERLRQSKEAFGREPHGRPPASQSPSIGSESQAAERLIDPMNSFRLEYETPYELNETAASKACRRKSRATMSLSANAPEELKQSQAVANIAPKSVGDILSK